MTATAAQIAQLRRMVAEPSTTTYSDTAIGGYIEAHPLLDENGEAPTELDASTTPPTVSANTNWIATYDLNAAAADIWEEKAATVAADFDFNADGASYTRAQVYEQYMKQTRYYRARRSAASMTLHKWPEETAARDFGWIGNLPEDDE